MTGGSKIIGMWRDRGEEPEVDNNELAAETKDGTLELSDEHIEISPENSAIEDQPVDDDWVYYGDETSSLSSKSHFIPPTLLGLSIAAWTGFLGWYNRDIFATMPTAQQGTDLFTQWCLPVATFAVLYMLYMRNSSREAARFTDVASALRAESEQLEVRLKTVNNELSIAREFLTQETKELEFLGDQSSVKLTTAANAIKTSLQDGLSSMNKLDDVANSAYRNLEQLREHLPVVINTAKDVTNQIGNSGRTAQAEIAAMVATLKRVGNVGTEAKKSMDALTEASTESLSALSVTAQDIKTSFESQLKEAESGSTRISSLLTKTSTDVIEALNKARTDLANETSETSRTITADLSLLETTLTNVRAAADEEDQRLKALVEELNQSVSSVSKNIADLDNESGEKTAKLAFAMTALEQNSTQLQKTLESGHGTADDMIARMEKLLIAIDSGARELDETLPAAFDRVTEKSEASQLLLDKITETISEAGATAEDITAKIVTSSDVITHQREKLSALKIDGTESTDVVLSKITALSESLDTIREQNEALAESSGEKLISALLRVKDTAKQASEHSREALENAITGSADTFEKVSEEALNRIIDEKIASIAPKLEEAVTKAVATTDSTAGHLQSQLDAIGEMTTNLEQRILFAKEKAEQSSDENFTRRVALLTESLNSTAIDVTKLLSNEVTDTEWAAYLKGDRGIFTRRAVRLLDSGEVREILAEYENNTEFREHVNRYIHDFEAMLRGVLATRDGSAISVTLLSSDIGKLYVALAQAIERLRG